ncbi:hypothetical protein IC575_022272 [Cucumis melo]
MLTDYTNDLITCLHRVCCLMQFTLSQNCIVLKKGDTLFLGQYLFTGSETSVWLEVGCVVKNSATLVGTMYTLHAAEIHIDLPTLTEKDKDMTNNLRPTRAVATDVANAVLDGSDAIILGAETLHGLHPVETVSTVSRICAEVICVCMR